MKKMNKMYEAPMAEVVDLGVNSDLMQGGGTETPIAGSADNNAQW